MSTLVLLVFSLAVHAINYTVTNPADGSATNQLRGAIDNASGMAGTHTITVNAGTYNLSSTINVGNINNQNITIVAATGATPIIDIGSIDRIFIFNTTGNTTGLSITLSGFILRNGRLTGDSYGGGAILSGGPGNIYNISNCTFTNNTIPNTISDGGAIECSGGGALTITNCSFTNNTTGHVGGALDFTLLGGQSGSLTITNSTFTNNTALVGGAITITTNQPIICNITGNTFTSNTANGPLPSSGLGGAMYINNSGTTGSTANINYNRFFGNTATNGTYSAVAVAAGLANTNLTNNWWGCNSGPTGCADKAATYNPTNGSTGTNTYLPYLQLRTVVTSGFPSSVCSGSATSVTSDFTINSVGNVIDPSNLSAFNNATIAFSAIQGTVPSPTVTITNGAASTNYTGTSAGTGSVSATFNSATVAVNITVNPAPSVTNPGSITVCAGTTASFSVTGSGSGTLSYQWYKGAAALNNGATGSGSTLSGVATTTLTITNPGTSDAGNYNIRVSSTSGCTPATSIDAILTVNTLPGFSSQPSSVTSGACTGNPVSFTAAGTGSGTLSYQWYKGTTALSNGTTGSGSIISGATTATLTISNASLSVNATNYNVIVSSSTGCTPATSNNTSLTITPPNTATATSTATESVSSSNTLITNSSCNPIVNVVPSGGAPVSGNVTATVTVQGSVQVSSNGSPFVPRYYDIAPATNPSTATATLTLYFTQAEFTAYNAYPGHGLNLPVDATDSANYKANIRIYVFHGSPNGGGNFPGPTETIDPVDANIVWNATYSRWEITFATTGFSRYYLASAGSTILPLNSISLTGHTDGNTAWLTWKVTGEKDVSRYEIERSTDGVQFTSIGQVAAGSSYQFADRPGNLSLYYYRLMVVDKDGRSTYSSVIAISLKKTGAIVQVLPNPFKEKLLLNINTAQQANTELRLMDMSGKVLVRKMTILQVGINAITLDGLQALVKGTYLLQVKNERLNETIKVLKAD